MEEAAIGLDPEIAPPEVLDEPTPGGEPVEPSEPEVPETPSDEGEAPAEGEGETAAPASGQDTLPSQVTKLARELSKERPELAGTLKHMRDAVFKNSEYEKTFGDIDAARNLKATFEAMGGEAGLQELQSASDDLRALDERVSTGDPQVIEAMITEAPEGFKKLIPHALERLAQIDPQGYENAIRPPLVRVLSNVNERLQEAVQWMEAGQPEFAKRQLSAISNWIGEQSKSSPKSAAGAPDPRGSDFEAREARLQEQEERNFVQSVGREAVPYIRGKVFEALKGDISAARLGTEAKNALFNDIMGQFDRLTDSETRNWKAMVRSRDSARAISYVKARADASVERIAREVFNTRYGSLVTKPNGPNGGGKAPTDRKGGPPGTQAGSGTIQKPLRIPKMPPDGEIDRSAPNWQMLLITGKARLKSGKYVQWK